MTTKNIKIDYGAAGDGQVTTATLTISSGSKNLSSSTNLWSSGDVGKRIAIAGAGVTNDPANPLSTLLSTISTFTDAQHVVIADNAVTSLSGVSKLVEWGTNDSAAFTNFKNDFQGQTGVQLDIPAGRYCFAGTGIGVGFGFGITGLTVIGSGSPILSDMLGAGNGWFLGGVVGAIKGDGTKVWGKTATVNAGATTIVLKTAADVLAFSANKWAVMTGLDLFGPGGFPPDPHFYEFVFVTAVHTGTTNSGGGDPSTVTVQDPLRNTYKSTWPEWQPETLGVVYLGGPATLYALQPAWDCEQEYVGLVISCIPTLYNSIGRKITFTGGSSPVFGPNCSVCKDVFITNHDIAALWEVDKMTDNVTITGGTIRGQNIQSSCPNLTTMTGVTMPVMSGTGKITIINNCTIGDVDNTVAFGPHSFGADTSVSASESSFTGFAFGGVREVGVNKVGVPGFGDYSMSNGVISRVKTAGNGIPPQWAIPGANCFWTGRYDAMASFRIIDITEDGTSIFVHTTWPGGFPTDFPGGNDLGIQVHPAPALTFINCTGGDAASWSLATPGAPIYSYCNRTYTGNIGTAQTTIPLSGTLVQAKFTVNTAYVGAGSPKLDWNPFAFVIRPDHSETHWTPSIDLKTVGTRTIRPGTSTTGIVGTDSGLDDPGLIWLLNNQMSPSCETDMSGGSVLPSITIEITTNQGLNATSGGILILAR